MGCIDGVIVSELGTSALDEGGTAVQLKGCLTSRPLIATLDGRSADVDSDGSSLI